MTEMVMGARHPIQHPAILFNELDKGTTVHGSKYVLDTYLSSERHQVRRGYL
jgi:hypothetical protein